MLAVFTFSKVNGAKNCTLPLFNYYMFHIECILLKSCSRVQIFEPLTFLHLSCWTIIVQNNLRTNKDRNRFRFSHPTRERQSRRERAAISRLGFQPNYTFIHTQYKVNYDNIHRNPSHNLQEIYHQFQNSNNLRQFRLHV